MLKYRQIHTGGPGIRTSINKRLLHCRLMCNVHAFWFISTSAGNPLAERQGTPWTGLAGLSQGWHIKRQTISHTPGGNFMLLVKLTCWSLDCGRKLELQSTQGGEQILLALKCQCSPIHCTTMPLMSSISKSRIWWSLIELIDGVSS